MKQVGKKEEDRLALEEGLQKGKKALGQKGERGSCPLLFDFY